MKFSSPGGIAQRPFQGKCLVLLDPNWFHKDHHATTHRRRTAASGTTEFQIRYSSKMVCNQQAISAVSRRFSSESAVYAPAARVAKNWPITTRRCAAELWLNGTAAGMDELRRLRVRAPGSSAEGSPRVRPACDLLSSVITDPRSGGLQITPKHRSQPRRNTEISADRRKNRVRSHYVNICL